MDGQGRLLISNVPRVREDLLRRFFYEVFTVPHQKSKLSYQLRQMKVRSLQGRDEEDVNDERGKNDVYRGFKETSLGPSLIQTDDQFSLWVLA
jgi:hypothetical protein